MNYQKWNVIAGWVVFFIASFVYISTIEPTASFWDCGEFIASAYKLEVGHPPGAPLFMLLARFFSMFMPTEYVAASVNVLSALSSSFTILFLFWTVTAFAKKLATISGEFTDSKKMAIIFSGVTGALAYTFSDSFWFSAVEGEVYAMSSLFTALVFWAIMKYDAEPDRRKENQWIVLIAYLMGLSIGVHLLNLLAIPAIGLVYYFKRHKATPKGIATALIISVLILGFVQAIIIPKSVWLAAQFELLFVNSMGLPFHSGVLFYFILLIALFYFGLSYAHKHQKPLLQTGILSVLVILIGYSTIFVVVVRSNANPPMDENNPSDVFTLQSYLNREQYGDRPLLHGQYFNSPIDNTKPRGDGKPVRMKAFTINDSKGRVVRDFQFEFDAKNYLAANSDKSYTIGNAYIIKDQKKGSVYNYNRDFTTIFPRMYSSQAHHIREYKKWSGFKGTAIRTKDNQGNPTIINKPKFFSENLRYFFSYQVNWMYGRYFMWNFAGKQNDIQGHGDILDGNWLSGIDVIDSQRLGNRSNLPESFLRNKALNHYLFFPLILALIGLVYQLIKDPKNFGIVGLLFLLTGMAVVIYLNQYPMQPRERDYAYVGSFYAFAIWIGLGVYALFDMVYSLKEKDLIKVLGYPAALGVLLFVLETMSNDNHSFSYTIFYFVIVAGLAIIVTMYAGKFIKNEKIVATLILILTLSVPYVMAKDAWDDHSRAKRRTALDFATDYLESCAPNAILFTNGDNDTFPLWYAQEVEGYRTDIRIVNLSLLNTDWYIDQMRRKAYDSDPVPFNVEEVKYRQGTRDVVLMNPDPRLEGRFINAKQAMKFAMNDDNTLPIGGGEKLSYIPTKNFELSVDLEKVIANGTVSRADTAVIVDKIQWTVNKNFLLKNQLMLLLLLAENDWERPIYFAVTTGSDAYLGLQDYFQLEGLAYRLVPIKTKNNNANLSGRVATDIMYENMMEKFKWGNMDTEDIYMDENNMRMTTNLRLQFSNLADALISEGDNERAKSALDRSLQVMPDRTVPYSRVLLPTVENYYELGEYDIANGLSDTLFSRYEAELDYYLSLDLEYGSSIKEDIQIANYMLQRFVQLTSLIYPQGEIGDDFRERSEVMNTLVGEYLKEMEEAKRKKLLRARF
jgi:tetratricopeptide (TPR) repeat protein